MDTELESRRRNSVDAAAEREFADGTDGTPAIVVQNLKKVYGRGDDSVQAVDGVNFEIERGTVVGLLGPNGAGKTTTIKSMLSLIVPTDGHVLVEDIDVHERPSAAFRRMGAMLEGARNVYWRLSPRENMEFFGTLAGTHPARMRHRHDELLAQFGLEDKADTVVRELSRGQKQKVSLLCTMARDASVVFLDEPTLGLDVESSLELRAELRSLVEDDGTTVVVSSHDMSVIEDICDRVIIMSDGRIVADDTVENLLNVFQTQAYEVRVAESVDVDVRRRLESAFDANDFERRADGTRFRVHVTSDRFYEVVDALRDASLSVESFDAVEPDLEEVFLRITDDGEYDGGNVAHRFDRGEDR